MTRNMINTNEVEATKNGWKIIVPFPGELIGKAVFDNGAIRIMKSTKRFKVPNGWMYNTSTEVEDNNGEISVAEALAFVPSGEV